MFHPGFRGPKCGLEKLPFAFSCLAGRKLCLGGPKRKSGIKIELIKSSVMGFSKKSVFCLCTAFEYL